MPAAFANYLDRFYHSVEMLQVLIPELWHCIQLHYAQDASDTMTVQNTDLLALQKPCLLLSRLSLFPSSMAPTGPNGGLPWLPTLRPVDVTGSWISQLPSWIPRMTTTNVTSISTGWRRTPPFIGSIKLHLSDALKAKFQDKGTITKLITALKVKYTTHGISGTFALFKELLETKIAHFLHPTPSLAQVATLFTCLEEVGYVFPANIQAMLLLAKLPHSMGVLAHMIAQAINSARKPKTSTVKEIHEAAVLSWDQCHIKETPKATQANRISSVKHKGDDPKFKQEQAPQGDSLKKKCERLFIPCPHPQHFSHLYLWPWATYGSPHPCTSLHLNVPRWTRSFLPYRDQGCYHSCPPAWAPRHHGKRPWAWYWVPDPRAWIFVRHHPSSTIWIHILTMSSVPIIPICTQHLSFQVLTQYSGLRLQLWCCWPLSLRWQVAQWRCLCLPLPAPLSSRDARQISCCLILSCHPWQPSFLTCHKAWAYLWVWWRLSSPGQAL